MNVVYSGLYPTLFHARELGKSVGTLGGGGGGGSNR